MGIGFGTFPPALPWPPVSCERTVADIISSIADLSHEVVCIKAPKEVKSKNVKYIHLHLKEQILYYMEYILW